jgi:hypothetical protein
MNAGSIECRASAIERERSESRTHQAFSPDPSSCSPIVKLFEQYGQKSIVTVLSTQVSYPNGLSNRSEWDPVRVKMFSSMVKDETGDENQNSVDMFRR